jgi:hypothetical protein
MCWTGLHILPQYLSDRANFQTRGQLAHDEDRKRIEMDHACAAKRA